MEKMNFKKEMDNITKYAKIMYDRGLVSASGGNISVLVSDNKYLITSSGSSFRDLNYDDIVLSDFDGNILDDEDSKKKPSKEYRIHSKCYLERKDIFSVVHLHPCYSIAFTSYNVDLPLFTSSAKLKLKNVPMVDEELPGSEELAYKVGESVKINSESKCFLIKAHGIVVFSSSIEDCLDLAELMEDTAKIALFSKNFIKE